MLAGRYRLEQRVGAGGGGTVWRAVDEALGRVVAIKRALPVDGKSDPERIRHLRREAKILARLNHPHVITLYDVVEEDGEWWLVMEYVAARSLADRGVLSPERAARLGADVAAALEAVHGAGIVHGDVKPGNVLVTVDGRAKLGDFGISRFMHGEVTFTDTGVLIAGTPAYIAPEVARGAKPTSASDVFSLGATLFAAVEGGSPYGPAGNLFGMLRQAAECRVAKSERGGELAPVMSALMRREPRLRPDAAATRQLLDAASSPSSKRRRVRSLPIRSARRWPSTRPAAVVACVIAVTLAAGAWIVIDPSSGPAATPRTTRKVTSSILGDPHTADPCALQDQTQLARFGSTNLDPAYGGFARCDVLVYPRDGGEVDVKAELISRDPPMKTPGRIDDVGGIKVWHEPGADDQCHRILLLGDSGYVDIGAEFNAKGSVDLCAIAETGVRSAVAVLSRGPLPRRTTRPVSASLFWSDACALLDAEGLSRFPGVDALHPIARFGNWECDWKSTTSHDRLLVLPDQYVQPSAEDGRPTRLGGHDAFVQPNGYGPGSCLVRVVHRRYTVSKSEKTELLLIVILGIPGGNADQRCRVASDIAEAAAAKLPRI
ncbi:serine/threonine-protein kinase [Actinomadura macra]|uniref:serine/threonine-protein kinase n=1 Tax=Actinomadura macra TaxID=46164 RepID=UPI000835161A|nr:serine/threonine-protein kinase [Actinomadura macra]